AEGSSPCSIALIICKTSSVTSLEPCS
ncbi:hypothetical protein D043_4081B, partial [Vibrio parahaemolyticus EKP-021]